MEKCHFQEMYPIYAREYAKTEIHPQSVDDVCQYFNALIAAHPFAKYICTFDHYSHTTEIEGGCINEAIVSAKNVLFCFGKKLGDPKVLSIRPRSIGICETESHFVISFLEAPNPVLTETMITWVRDLVA